MVDPGARHGLLHDRGGAFVAIDRPLSHAACRALDRRGKPGDADLAA
jgi:hypothetical protein